MLFKIKARYSLSELIMGLFFIYMITYHLFSERAETLYISQSVMLVLLLCLFLYFLRHRKFILSWRMAFVILWCLTSLLSYFVSPLQSDSFSRWLTIFQLCVFLILLSHYLDTDKKIDQALRCMLYSYIVLGFYMVYVYGFGLFSPEFMDVRVGDEVSQINTLGMSLAYGSVFSFFYFYIKKKKWVLFFVVFLTILSSFTGSRKAIVIIAIGIIGILSQEFRFDKRRMFRNIILVLIVAIALSSLSYFEMVLSRFDGILSLLSGESQADSSANVRFTMILKGIDLFWEKPIFGSGLGTFKYYWSDNVSGRMYSHNNYIELLVNGGIVSFVVYYFNYIYLLFAISKKRTQTSILLLTILSITMIVDLFVVSYYAKDVYIMIAIYYGYVYNYSSKDNQESLLLKRQVTIE